MSDTRSGPEPGATVPPVAEHDRPLETDAARDREAFAELQHLLVGPERVQIAEVAARLDPEARRRELADVLPHVLIEHTSDPRFTHALTPPVERAITASVRRNPAPLADALFPVIGPAIRKAVSAALAGMVEALNRTLEHSLSWRSLSWRFEALRTGKSFGEVMLLHTLVYRVEQVFLIERTSGLLLHHVTEGEADVRDADMVSGMLTAIRDFVQDSFKVSDSESLEALKVGELSVWIEQGPRAVIAAVLRGTAPRTYRTTLQAALERIHLEFTDEFESFRGDAAPFEGARPTLEGCLHTEYQASARPNHRTLWAAAAVAALALAVWAGFTYRSRARDRHYLDALRGQPGIVVLSADRRGGTLHVNGLRDPLARNPEDLLQASGLTTADVTGVWQPYYAASPELALARARQVLQPPAAATLDLQNGALTVSGAAPLDWIAEASRLAPLVPGISSLDASAVSNAAVRDAIAKVEQISPLFAKGQVTLARGQEEVLRELVARMADLERSAAAVKQRFRVEVIGHTDSDGAPEANLPLSRARATVVRAALQTVAGDRLVIVEEGVGSDDPVVRSNVEVDKQRNRRVTVRVTPATAPAGGARP